MNECEAAAAALTSDQGGFHAFFAERAFASTKLALFLFHVCHLVVLHSPTHALDMKYIRLFQTLEAIR